MTLDDAAYSRSPARIRPQSSAPTLATSPRASMIANNSNSSPAPRVPMGRSPHKVAIRNSQAQFAQAAGEEEDGERRSSVDSSAIFSIYSMYGSEYGSGPPPLPVGADTASGSRRESQGPSSLSSSPYSINHAHQDAPHTNAAWASNLGNNGHTGQDQHQGQGQTRNSLFQQHRQRSQEGRISQVAAASSRVPFEAAGHSDSEHRSTGFSTTTAAQASSPPSSYQPASGVNGNHVAHRSSSFSSYSDDLRRVQSDNEDDESLAFDVEFGSTAGTQSSPPSPSSKKASMSFFSSSSRRSKKSKRATANSTASNTELAYFDSGVMPSMPAPPRTPSPSSAGTSRAPSAMTGARAGLDRLGLESKRDSYTGSGNDSANDDFSGKLHGSQQVQVNGKNNNRLPMSNRLPDSTSYNRGSPSTTPSPPEEAKSWDKGHVHNLQPGVHPQAATPSSQFLLHGQPPAPFVSGVSPSHPFPLQPTHLHTPSNASAYSNSYFSSRSTSPSVSVYATPLTTISPTAVTVLGTAKPEYHAPSTESAESTASMPVNNGFRLGYQTPSSLSRRGSPSPSTTPGPTGAPPSAYQSNNHHQQHSSNSNPGSRRQTPSPAPSRTGSLAAPAPAPAPPSISHSPNSSLSQQSTHSHRSYGASSVITKDTAISAISGTTATSSGSRADESVPPPIPMYHSYGQQTPPSMLGRQESQASQASHYSSSVGHGSIGEMQIPRVDKDLPDMLRENGAANRASGYSNPGSRRPSPVPSLSVNGSPHLLNGDTGGIGPRQGRLVQNGISHRANDSLSPSISQQSTTMTTTSGTSASVSSTGATTANSSPDPNYRSGGPSPMNSPHASLQAPHRSSSSMRTRGNSPSTLHQNPGNSPHQSLLSGPPGSIKGHSTPSLVPSLGEDLDAFHVRNTYAVLEVSGVKGDGYEEGVERTRAARTRAASNMSPSPSRGGADASGSAEDGASSSGHAKARKTKSQVLADDAIADENEKKRELDPKEIQILSSLDRYGFFNVPSHDRLLLMPSAPLTKPLPPFSAAAASSITPSSPPPPGSGNASATPRTLSALPPVVTPPKETERIAKWGRMLVPHERDEGGNVQAWRIRPNKVNKLRRRTYKGIPDRWRAAAWEVLMTAYSSASEEGGNGSSGNDGAGVVSMERTLRNASSEATASGGVRQVKVAEREYRDCLDKPSTYDIQIDLDVPRTISGHIMFRTRYGAGQRSLFHVLHSFSLRCVTCGYVQGMGPIAATLLSYMAPSLAYTSLVRLHDAYAMHSIFAPGFPGLLEAIYVQERLTQATMPGVYAAFQKHMISTTSYATKWYITLFANSVPFQTQLRFWDVFLLEGPDVYIAVAIAVVWVYRDHITSAAANFETVLSLLSGFFVPEDENQLLGWMEKMLGDKRIRGAMRAWRLEWRELVKQGKDGSALL